MAAQSHSQVFSWFKNLKQMLADQADETQSQEVWDLDPAAETGRGHTNIASSMRFSGQDSCFPTELNAIKVWNTLKLLKRTTRCCAFSILFAEGNPVGCSPHRRQILCTRRFSESVLSCLYLVQFYLESCKLHGAINQQKMFNWRPSV